MPHIQVLLEECFSKSLAGGAPGVRSGQRPPPAGREGTTAVRVTRPAAGGKNTRGHGPAVARRAPASLQIIPTGPSRTPQQSRGTVEVGRAGSGSCRQPTVLLAAYHEYCRNGHSRSPQRGGLAAETPLANWKHTDHQHCSSSPSQLARRQQFLLATGLGNN